MIKKAGNPGEKNKSFRRILIFVDTFLFPLFEIFN
jgi:hypothetical protein